MKNSPPSALDAARLSRYLPAMKMHHLLPLLPLFFLLSGAAPAVPSAPSGIPAWDTAWSFDPAPDAPTYRSLEPGLIAFWTDFLGTPPAGLEAVAPDFARTLALGIDSPSDAADLLARAFPDAPPPTDRDPPPALRFSTDTDAPAGALPLPWVHAAACIRHAAGLTNSALEHWNAIAIHGDAPPSPVPDADRSWRDLYASAMAVHRYLLATSADPDRAPTAIRRRRAALLPLGARRAAEAVVLLDPKGPRGRVVLATLIPEKPTLAARPPNGLGLTPLSAAFADLGCSNAIACIFRARAEIAWAGCCRGNDLAVNVTPEGWRGFEHHNAIGVEYALRARALEPDWPHAWLALMTPAGSGCYPDETLPSLARAALARQIDYGAILPPLFNYSLPRWRPEGGAGDALRALRALVDLPRPDTDLPFRAVKYLEFLVADQTRAARTAYARAGCPAPLDLDIRLWPAFRDMFERYLAAPAPAVPRPEVLRAYLAAAARFRDPAPALAALDRLAPDELAALWTEPDRPGIPRGATLAGPGGIPALRTAAAIDAVAPRARARHAAALAIGHAAGASNALDAVRAALPAAFPDPTPAATNLLARMERDQTIALDWEPLPVWTALDRSTIPIDGEGTDWLRLPTGGSLASGTAWKTGAFFRHPYERVTSAAADFTLYALPAAPGAPPPGFYVRLNANRHYGAGILCKPTTGECQAFVTSPTNTRYRHAIATTNLPPLPPPEPDRPAVIRLRVRLAAGRLDAWLDNTPVFDAIPLPADFPPEPDFVPAFGTSSPPPGPVFAIDRIRVVEYLPPP